MRLNDEIFKQLSHYKIDGSEGFLSNYEGERKSRQKGQSQEFSDFRPYYVGDDIRMIDWNAYARTDQHYVKMYEEERETRITIILDHSASMGIHGSKPEFAKTLVMIFAYVGLSAGDSVRLITQDTEGKFRSSDYYKGVDKQHRIRQILDRKTWQGVFDINAVNRDVTFTKGITILISDFLYEGVDCLHRHLKFSKQHVIALQVLTAETLEPDIQGPSALQNIESDDVLELNVTAEVMQTYKETLNAHLEAIEAIMASAGDRYVMLNANKDNGAQLLHKLLLHHVLR